MASPLPTFSESWHRVASQKLSLRPNIKVSRQRFRGELWHVLENPLTNQFFRVRPETYEFIARLDSAKTVQEVWDKCIEKFPDSAPGQEEAIRLLSQLYNANLLHYRVASDSAELFRRFKTRRQRELSAKLRNIMFIRIPLFDPDDFLKRTLPVVGCAINRFGAIIWMAIVGFALKLVIDNFPSLRNESQAILSMGNLPLLYIGLVFIKTFHEFGHAYFCRKYGGEVHTMGIMLLIFTPIPYVDATSSWSFRSRWQRMWVGLAGVIVELFVAAVATVVWVNTAPGVIHSLAYNMMFIASVSSLMFNLNPLLRFDGYYILSDLLDIPNLHQRAGNHLKHLFKKYAFGHKTSASPSVETTEKSVLTVFGILSTCYRLFIFGVILLFVADQMLILGVIMALVCIFSWIILPLSKFLRYLIKDRELEPYRQRAYVVVATLLIGVILLTGVVSFPHHFRSPGVVQAKNRAEIVALTAGTLESILVADGKTVQQGTPLVRFDNWETALALEAAELKREEILARLLEARKMRPADVAPLTSQLESTLEQINFFKQRQADQVIRAPLAGRWVSPKLTDNLGKWHVRGEAIGLVIDEASYEFTATVRQNNVDRLFSTKLDKAEIRLHGEAKHRLHADELSVIPVEQRNLPSASLGWAGGGNVPTDISDPRGTTAAEPFFEVSATITTEEEAYLAHGRSGNIRIRIGSTPLLQRLFRGIRQLLQQRYQL